MDWLKDVNNRIAETRDQEFRSKSQQYIDNANITKARNMDAYGKGTYVLRSPGNDLLDFYDQQLNLLDPKGRAWSPIPPSVVYHYRFDHAYPAELFDKSKNYGRLAYLRDQLKNYYVTNDKTYWGQIYKERYKWLVDKPHEEFRFQYQKELDQFGQERFNQNISQKISPNEIGRLTEKTFHTMYWRGKLAGWSIVFIPNKRLTSD